MAHTIFSTRGIILKRQSTGETNIFVYILTENLGLVIANAQGVRTSKSKLSSSLTEFSFGTYSLVKAKNGWRVTDAESDGNFYFNLKRDKGEDKQNNFNAQNLLAKISDLLIKLIPGESHDQKLFECVNSGFKFLVSESSSDSIENNLECILVLRILYLLGYVVKEGETGEFLENISEWNENLISKSSQNRVKIISVINKGIKESHLT